MVSRFDNIADNKKTSIDLGKHKVGKLLNSACKVIKNLSPNFDKNKKPQSYLDHRVSTTEELQSNLQLLKDIKKYDPNIFPLIECCIKNDIRTFASCQGHPENGDKLGYIGFDEPNSPKVRDIVKYISLNKVKDKIAFNNFGITADFQCTVSWPVEETKLRVQEIVALIENKIIVDDAKIPEMISLMEKLSHMSAENNIDVAIGRKGVSKETSQGHFNLMMHSKSPAILSDKFKKIIKTLDNLGFDKTVINNYYVTEWNEKIGDKKVCDTFNKVINILEDK